MRFMSQEMECKSLSQLQKLGSKWFRSNLKEVLIIPRKEHGQMYIVKGLGQSAHFSLRSNGVGALRNLFGSKGINVHTANGSKRWINHQDKLSDKGNKLTGFYVVSTPENTNQRQAFEVGYQNKMKEMSKVLWPALMLVSVYYDHIIMLQ